MMCDGARGARDNRTSTFLGHTGKSLLVIRVRAELGLESKKTMSRRTAKVVLLHRDAFSMVGDWIDHIELRRDAHATLAVWGTSTAKTR